MFPCAPGGPGGPSPHMEFEQNLLEEPFYEPEIDDDEPPIPQPRKFHAIAAQLLPKPLHMASHNAFASLLDEDDGGGDDLKSPPIPKIEPPMQKKVEVADAVPRPRKNKKKVPQTAIDHNTWQWFDSQNINLNSLQQFIKTHHIDISSLERFLAKQGQEKPDFSKLFDHAILEFQFSPTPAKWLYTLCLILGSPLLPAPWEVPHLTSPLARLGFVIREYLRRDYLSEGLELCALANQLATKTVALKTEQLSKLRAGKDRVLREALNQDIASIQAKIKLFKARSKEMLDRQSELNAKRVPKFSEALSEAEKVALLNTDLMQEYFGEDRFKIGESVFNFIDHIYESQQAIFEDGQELRYRKMMAHYAFKESEKHHPQQAAWLAAFCLISEDVGLHPFSSFHPSERVVLRLGDMIEECVKQRAFLPGLGVCTLSISIAQAILAKQEQRLPHLTRIPVKRRTKKLIEKIKKEIEHFHTAAKYCSSQFLPRMMPQDDRKFDSDDELPPLISPPESRPSPLPPLPTLDAFDREALALYETTFSQLLERRDMDGAHSLAESFFEQTKRLLMNLSLDQLRLISEEASESELVLISQKIQYISLARRDLKLKLKL
jgi:hypothetical protein